MQIKPILSNNMINVDANFVVIFFLSVPMTANEYHFQQTKPELERNQHVGQSIYVFNLEQFLDSNIYPKWLYDCSEKEENDLLKLNEANNLGVIIVRGIKTNKSFW